MKDILILTTATLRPELLQKTYGSFWTNLFHGDESVCMNIDCVGNNEKGVSYLINKLVRISQYFFKGNSYTRVEKNKPNFTDAFLFVWNMASKLQKEYKYVFYLEDDWFLRKKVYLYDMVEMLESEEDLAILRFPHKPTDKDRSKNWNQFFPWNGKYFECPDNLKLPCGFCGHPSLIKMPFVVNTAPLLNRDMNPEKQFHRKDDKMKEEILKWRYGVFAKPEEPLYIEDTGRDWMIKNKLQKKGPKSFFTEWETLN